MKQQAIIILEPLNHMFKVLQTAHERGYVAISMNSLGANATPPYEAAQACVDAEYRVPSWTDRDAVLQVFERIKNDFDVVGTYASSEITLPLDAIFREQLGLPNSGVGTVVRNLDKLKVRSLLRENGLSNLRTLSMAEIQDLTEWPFPGSTAFFKPNSGAGSANVWHCRNMDDVKKCLEKWSYKDEIPYSILLDLIDSTGQYFLEEAAIGKLFSVESLVVDGTVNVMGFTDRAVSARDAAIEMGLFFPYKNRFEQQIIDKISKIHQAMGIKHGPTHAEIIVDEKGNIELVEMNLRFAGYDMLAVVSHSLQQDVSELLVDLALGKQLKLELPEQIRKAAAISMVMPPLDIEVFDSISFPDSVHFSKVMKPLSHKVISHDSQLDYIGSCVFTAESYEDLLQKNEQIRKQIIVNGKSIEHCQNNEIQI